MKRNITLIIIGILLFLAGFQLANILANRKIAKLEQEYATIYASEPETDEEAEISSRLIGVDLSGLVAVDSRGNEMKISELSGDKIVFARFSVNACPPCVEALTSSLKDFIAENPDWHVVFLVADMPLRDMHVQQVEYGSIFSFYAVNHLPIDFNAAQTPVAFRLDDSGRIKEHFTCRSGDSQRTIDYINKINK